MKRILSIVLAVIMVFSMTAFASARSYNPYRDYDYDYYYDNDYDYNWDYYRNHDRYEDYFADIYGSDNRDAIEYLYDLDILEGYGNGYYGPDEILTRAEACTIIVRMMLDNYEIYSSRNSKFSDVASNAWYAKYVDTAEREGYMNGYGDGTFGPEDDVSYAQFATIVLNMLGYDMVNFPGTWPENAVYMADELDLFYFVGSHSNSKAIPREDVAQMIYNALDCEMVYWRNGKVYESGVTLEEYIDGAYYTHNYDLSDVEVSQIVDFTVNRNTVSFKTSADGMTNSWHECPIDEWDFRIDEMDWAKITYDRNGDVKSVKFWSRPDRDDEPETFPEYVNGIVTEIQKNGATVTGVKLDTTSVANWVYPVSAHCDYNNHDDIEFAVGVRAKLTIEDGEVVEIDYYAVTVEDEPETETACWYVAGVHVYHMTNECPDCGEGAIEGTVESMSSSFAVCETCKDYVPPVPALPMD